MKEAARGDGIAGQCQEHCRDPHLALAPAKINWTLAVMGRRPDGFHEIGSLVSPVTLYDELVLRQGVARESPRV